MPAFRYVFNMEEHRPALRVVVFSRGGIVNGAQTAVNTVTVHETHDIQIGDKFLYALTRANIRVDRVFNCTARTSTTVGFSGLPFTFPDKCTLVGIGVDTGGVEQVDGSFSKLLWDGSTIDVGKDPNMDDLYPTSEVGVDPGGEVGFWADATDIWVLALSTGGQPLRTYIFSFVDAVPAAIAESVPTPTTTLLNGAYAWYRADAITDLADGATVTAWLDQSGNGRNLTSAGITDLGVANAVRPKWNAKTSSKGTGTLPVVSLEGVDSSPWGYFAIDTGPFALTIALGWTIAMIVRDYGLPFSGGDNTILGHGTADNNDDFIAMSGRGSSASQMRTETGPSPKYFSNSYGHTDANDTEAVVLRAAATAGTLRAWVDGALMPSTGDGGNAYTRVVDMAPRYIGQRSAVGSTVGTQAIGFAELIVFNRALTDSEVGTLNAYLVERMASASGAALGGGIPRNIGTSPAQTFIVGGVPALPTDSACTNGTAYVGSVFVPANVPLTGIQYLVGSVGGTDNVRVSLHNAAGAVVAASAVAGVTVGTANQIQQVAFNAPTSVAGPAWYFIALTFNGTTAKFRTMPLYSNAGSGVIGNGVTQLFNTIAAFTPPTTFTADKVPIASVY